MRCDVHGLELERGYRRLAPVLVALAVSSAWPSRALAAEPSASAPRAAQALRIWYRSSEGCPDGAAFLELLGRLGRAASLAGVGDRVDFVVTVAHAPGQGSGRLERQSSAGTVAIRDVVAASCGEAADALALSLDLALEPGAPAAPAEPAAAAWQTRLGAQGQLASGLAGTVLPGAAIFVDLGRVPPGWSGRLSLWGARGEQDAAVDLSLGLLGSRLESCWSWRAGALALSPCAGLELGILVAEGSGAGGRSDTGLWSSAVAHLRGGWHFSSAIALEVQAGLVVPFVRYRFDALTGGEVAESAALGLEAALGLSFLL